MFFPQQKDNNLFKILIMSSTPSPSLKLQNLFTCLTQDVSYVTVKSILSVCELEASSFNITLASCMLDLDLLQASESTINACMYTPLIQI